MRLEIAHQFEDAEQQRNAATLGMWLFLATEILFFGGMFLGYAIYRMWYHAAFAEASRKLDIVLGAANTGVLLCSSLTMAMSVHEAESGRRKTVSLFLLLTIVLGLAFLGVKFYEYHHKYEEGLIPGAGFLWEGADGGHASLFFVFYFLMTGMHAVHMIVGVGMMSALIYLNQRGRFSARYYSPVELGGLYWHFVDIVWVFLFPLLYLIDRSQ